MTAATESVKPDDGNGESHEDVLARLKGQFGGGASAAVADDGVAEQPPPAVVSQESEASTQDGLPAARTRTVDVAEAALVAADRIIAAAERPPDA